MILVVALGACGGGGAPGPAGPDDSIARCDRGDGQSCNDLGDKYAYGDEQNAPLAVSYFERSCDLRHWPGCNRLGDMYVNGTGVPRDLAAAARLFELACGHDEGTSCYDRASLYNDFLRDCDVVYHDIDTYKPPAECEREGVQDDAVTKAIAFLRKACSLQNEAACKVMTAYDKKPGLVSLGDSDYDDWLLYDVDPAPSAGP